MPDRSKEIVGYMMANDDFSQWLGIEVLEVSPGNAKLQMTVREEMTNGFKIAHGGITYSLADSALAFASNGYGKQAVSIETSISHTRPVAIHDILTAVAIEKNKTKRTGIYEVIVSNQDGKVVALFKGTVFYREEEWPENLSKQSR
ncbi:MAG: hydroxyphenylacetyl-CoA thioesterase PaaI [Flavobacteriia bacterium]|nr:hydroxyphenylacetyl-CoA thioesterase PaaI [Flavobacteriia bacterium]